MKLHHFKGLTVYFLFGVFFLTGCAHQPVQSDRPKTYTAYNMWVQRGGIIPTINYQVGKLIPAGTEVVDAWVAERTDNVGRNNSFIRFKVVET